MEDIIQQNACFDEPTVQDYKRDPEDELSGIKSAWPKNKVTVQNQGQTPACTFYSAYHLINGYNILEDERQGVNRPQINPATPWNTFCKKRGYSNKGYSIQGAATEAKGAGMIEGWATIDKTEPIDVQISKMKKALDSGYFISTGSSNGDWTQTKINKTYTLRTDGKFVGHAWSVIDYDSDGFIAINSYGPLWADKGYFRVPFNMVDKLYSKLVLIDKDDSGYFAKLKEKSKAMEGVRQLKAIYALSIPQADKDMCARLATSLRNSYGFTDADL